MSSIRIELEHLRDQMIRDRADLDLIDDMNALVARMKASEEEGHD
jgi:hypothetical protein